MVTRRVRNREFRLRPSKRTNQVIGYVVAVMQERYNIRIHAKIVMSNHWHLVVTDPDGNVVDFYRNCHQFIARALNTYYNDSENMWSTTATSRVECVDYDDVIAQIAYTMANPVEAGLVKFGHSWPGLRVAWPAKPMVFKRPKKFFRAAEAGGNWPETATLVLSRPPGYDELSDDELAGVIKSAVDEREDRFRAEHAAAGRPFLGRRRVLEQSRYQRPTSKETRFGISPKVACRDKWARIERLQRNKRWGQAYCDALQRWRDGERDVEFPYGTYKMRVVHGVRCAPPPD